MIGPRPFLDGIHRDDERMVKEPGLIYLDRNERFGGFDEAMFRDMLATLRPRDLCVYPDTEPFMERLIRHVGLEREFLQITPGADGAVRRVFQAWVEPRDRVVVATPSWAMFKIYTQLYQGVVDAVSYGNDLSLDIDRLIDASSGARLIAFATPSQPTGTVLTVDEVRRIATAARRGGTMVLVDETYYPFSQETSVGLVEEFDNLAIVRSFSKAAGMPGIRLGYLVGHPSVITAAGKTRGSYEVNALALAIGCFVLDRPDFMTVVITDVENGRTVLQETAGRLDLETPECPANFQLVRLPGSIRADAVVADLLANGYVVKGGTPEAGLDNCLRVTLDGPEIMRGFCAALEKVIKQIRS